ncbi:MAG: DUF599 family protein [Gammaproteobacteria bacterium]|nr:DUF599 family protein [Gammaproteobacteria bacterium]
MIDVLEQFSGWDGLALSWFFICWVGFTLVADYSALRTRSVTAAVNYYRKQWMIQMLKREMKMIDTQIMGNLGNGLAFFASTSVLIIGGLSAALGAGETMVGILKDIPFTDNTSRLAYDTKIILLIGIFVYAFIKFAWSFRLSNYCSILIGASPSMIEDEARCVTVAELPARLSGLAGSHFNRGLRSYFFAMAALGWFINAHVFLMTTTLILVTQYRREFRSRSLNALQQGRTLKEFE